MKNRYLSLLRGINVSGQKKIKMDDLKSLYSGNDFEDVLTYIQSGNVIFTSNNHKENKLKSIIEKAIEQQFGFFVPVEIRSITDLAKIVKNLPFDRDKADFEGNKYHVTFLTDVPSKNAISEIQRFVASDEKLIIKGREVYFHCPGSYGKTKLSNNFIEKKFATAATTRNWKTLTKLLELAL